jgi:hypothetical protein
MREMECTHPVLNDKTIALALVIDSHDTQIFKYDMLSGNIPEHGIWKIKN